MLLGLRPGSITSSSPNLPEHLRSYAWRTSTVLIPFALGESNEAERLVAADGMKRLRSKVGAIVWGVRAKEPILSGGLRRSRSENESTTIRCNEMDGVW